MIESKKNTRWNTIFIYLAGLSALLLLVATWGSLIGRSHMNEGVEVTGEISGTDITYSSEATTWYHVVWECEGKEYKGTYVGSA